MTTIIMSTENNQETKEPGKYAVFSIDSLKIICEMSGYENLNHEILSSLSSNATYRLQEIIEECALFMRNSKTSYLTTSLVNEIFIEKHLPKIYGYDQYLDDQSLEYIPAADIYTENDKILDINTLLGTYEDTFNEENEETIFNSNSLNHLYHPDLNYYKFEKDDDNTNVNDVDMNDIEHDNDEDDDDYETGLHSNYIFPFNETSEAFNEINDEYYHIIIKSIYESSDNVFNQIIMKKFLNNKNFGYLGNQFLNFLLEQFIKYPFNETITPRLLIFTECLLMNNSFYIHEILILHLIKRLTKNLLSKITDDEDDEDNSKCKNYYNNNKINRNDQMRYSYAELLHLLIPRVDQRLNTLSLILKNISEILYKSINSYSRGILYGSLIFISFLKDKTMIRNLLIDAENNDYTLIVSLLNKTNNDFNLDEIFFKIYNKISTFINWKCFYEIFGDRILLWDKNLNYRNNSNINMYKLRSYSSTTYNNANCKLNIIKNEVEDEKNKKLKIYYIKKSGKNKSKSQNIQRKYIPDYSPNFII